jgi:hypothetical protein
LTGMWAAPVAHSVPIVRAIGFFCSPDFAKTTPQKGPGCIIPNSPYFGQAIE